MLWLRHRLATTAPIILLAWELPYASGVAPGKTKKTKKTHTQKKKKKKKTKTKKEKMSLSFLFNPCPCVIKTKQSILKDCFRVDCLKMIELHAIEILANNATL